MGGAAARRTADHACNESIADLDHSTCPHTQTCPSTSRASHWEVFPQRRKRHDHNNLRHLAAESFPPKNPNREAPRAINMALSWPPLTAFGFATPDIRPSALRRNHPLIS